MFASKRYAGLEGDRRARRRQMFAPMVKGGNNSPFLYRLKKCKGGNVLKSVKILKSSKLKKFNTTEAVTFWDKLFKR